MNNNGLPAAPAAVLNACWWIRNARGPVSRRAYLDQLASMVVAALDAYPDQAEAILYAVAAGLHDRRHPTFSV